MLSKDFLKENDIQRFPAGKYYSKISCRKMLFKDFLPERNRGECVVMPSAPDRPVSARRAEKQIKRRIRQKAEKQTKRFMPEKAGRDDCSCPCPFYSDSFSDL
jgi:hypothetical protein